MDDIREAVLSLQQEARAEPNRNEAVEELVSVTKLYNSGCLYLGGTRISANHYNTVLTHARKSWLKRGLNNEKLATQSDLIAAGYTLTNNQIQPMSKAARWQPIPSKRPAEKITVANKHEIYNTNFNDNKKNVTKLRKKVPIYLAANK